VIKKIFSVIGLLTVTFLLAAVGASCSNDKITATLGKEFTIPAGKTAIISSEDLTVKFVGVDSDSRCAKDVLCVSAGEAKFRMIITYKGSASDVIVTQSGGGDFITNESFLQYKVSVKLDPYPESSIPIAKSDYKLVMTVIK
jgi:hypothetical protein